MAFMAGSFYQEENLLNLTRLAAIGCQIRGFYCSAPAAHPSSNPRTLPEKSWSPQYQE